MNSPENFREELETLINSCNRDCISNTPDWILAEYLSDCLASFDLATTRREKWHGRNEVDAVCLDRPPRSS
jgi:hypothetical protein